ncbi:MAG: class I SAM-dependent RNA methyltransferase [Deltaproteobacteria bacterium]|nr:class I SAM-dependent RNA methyltransferase [Deltaproteobacteria bacterium]
MSKPQNRYFAMTTPGFEAICAAELVALGIAEPEPLCGGVEFSGDLRELYLANLWLRSASRVLVRVGEVTARDFPTLFKRLLRLPWGRFVKPGSSCKIRVTCHRSRLSHSGRVAETCLAAIAKALGDVAEDSAAPVSVFLRLEADRCQVSIDSSGELLHRRGYRMANVAAPLRENLAAGCLLALGYDGSRPLIDAMTGSGTFAIEAALMALNRAPGAGRQFAFMAWPKYRPGLWQQLLQQAQRAEKTALAAPILALDNNPRAIAAARQNLMTAGLAEQVQLDCRPMQQLQSRQPSGLLICNPPYGERIGRTAALLALYRDLGRIYAAVFSAWQGAIICPDSELVRATGIPFESRLRFSNGGIRVALLQKP